MFNLQSEVNRLRQLQHAKIHGLPIVRQPKNPKVDHVDGILYEMQANQEGQAIPKSFHNRSMDFGLRLRKVKGQKHYPGGGFAGHITKGA